MCLPPACTWNNEFKTRIPRRVKIMILLNMNWRITFTHDLRAPGPYVCPNFCKGILRWATVIEMKLISPHGSEVGQHHSRISLCLLGTYSFFDEKESHESYSSKSHFVWKGQLERSCIQLVHLLDVGPTGSPPHLQLAVMASWAWLKIEALGLYLGLPWV